MVKRDPRFRNVERHIETLRSHDGANPGHASGSNAGPDDGDSPFELGDDA